MMSGTIGCSVCGKAVSEEELFVMAETPEGRVCFCEECYRIGYFSGLSCEGVTELHYRFGVAYSEAARFSEGIDALHAAMRLQPRGEMLQVAAHCYEQMGNAALAAALRRQAAALI